MIKDIKYLAILPLIFGIWTSVLYIMRGEAYQLIWFCNINNFLMAYAIFKKKPVWVWVATIWLIIGTPLWLYEDILKQNLRPHAIFVHLGSSAIGLWFIKKTAVRPKWVFQTTFMMGALSQVAARLFTDYEHNVNMAYFVYPTLTEVFPNFTIYNLFNYFIFTLCILFQIKIFEKFFVQKSQEKV